MTTEERQRWDERYRTGAYQPRASGGAFLEAWIDRLPSGRALDIACGAGRHAFRLAEAGLDVEAVDISAVAIELARREANARGLQIAFRVADLDDEGLAAEHYDVITVIRYMNRALWPRLIRALRPGGILMIEHHLRAELRDSDEVVLGGPKTDAFRLAPQELLGAFGQLRVLFYEESVEPADNPDERFALARMVAVKGRAGQLPTLR